MKEYIDEQKPQIDINWHELLVAGTFIGQFVYLAFGRFSRQGERRTSHTLDDYHKLLFVNYINRCLPSVNKSGSEAEASDFYDKTMETLHGLVYRRYEEYIALHHKYHQQLSDNPYTFLVWSQEMASNIVIPIEGSDDDEVKAATFTIALAILDHFKRNCEEFPMTDAKKGP